jgi:hypothetical protein
MTTIEVGRIHHIRVDRAVVRIQNPSAGETLVVFPIESPETCPRCQQRRCVFLERQPKPLCLACSTPTAPGYAVVDAGGGALVGVPLDDLVEAELRGGRA